MAVERQVQIRIARLYYSGLTMAELNRMIDECKELRAFHVERRNQGVRGAGIEALAVAIRERALLDAKQAVLRENA